MPDEDSILILSTPKEYKNHSPSTRVPFVVCANFEACTKSTSGCEPSNDESFTNKYQKHKPCGFCYQIVCFDDKHYSQDPVIYKAKSEDKDVAQIFLEMLMEKIKSIHKKFDFAMKMIFTDEDRQEFKEAKRCWIC